MSRYTVPSTTNVTVTLGWEPQSQSFFLQVWEKHAMLLLRGNNHSSLSDLVANATAEGAECTGGLLTQLALEALGKTSPWCSHDWRNGPLAQSPTVTLAGHLDVAATAALHDPHTKAIAQSYAAALRADVSTTEGEDALIGSANRLLKAEASRTMLHLVEETMVASGHAGDIPRVARWLVFAAWRRVLGIPD